MYVCIYISIYIYLYIYILYAQVEVNKQNISIIEPSQINTVPRNSTAKFGIAIARHLLFFYPFPNVLFACENCFTKWICREEIR